MRNQNGNRALQMQEFHRVVCYSIQGLYRDNGRENLNSLKVGYIHNNGCIWTQVTGRARRDFRAVPAALAWHNVLARENIIPLYIPPI